MVVAGIRRGEREEVVSANVDAAAEQRHAEALYRRALGYGAYIEPDDLDHAIRNSEPEWLMRPIASRERPGFVPAGVPPSCCRRQHFT